MQTGVAVKKAIVDRRNPKQQETKSSRDRDEGLGIGMKGRRPTMTLGIMEDVFITLSSYLRPGSPGRSAGMFGPPNHLHPI